MGKDLEVSERAVRGLDPRQDVELARAFDRADTLLSKLYLNAMGTTSVVPLDAELAACSDADSLNETTRFFEVTQVVLDASENSRDKLVSVFNAVCSAGAGLLMLIHGTKSSVSIKLGVKAPDADSATKCSSILQSSLIGNFPGTKISPVRKDELSNALGEAFDVTTPAVVSVTDVAGVRSEQESQDRHFIQGIEKVVDAMCGREYTILLIADSVSPTDLAASRRSLENLYSSLVSFSESQLTLGANESEAVSKSISKSFSKSISTSVSETVSRTVGKTETKAETRSENAGVSFCGVNVGGSLSQQKSESYSDS